MKKTQRERCEEILALAEDGERYVLPSGPQMRADCKVLVKQGLLVPNGCLGYRLSKSVQTDEPGKRCSYEDGPCQAMANHARPSAEGKRAGIVAQDNRCLVTDPEMRLFHAGFALFGSPDERVRKSGVMLNFCPWCGADLMQWHEDFRKALAARREEIEP